jgi:hypothetical protein
MTLTLPPSFIDLVDIEIEIRERCQESHRDLLSLLLLNRIRKQGVVVSL